MSAKRESGQAVVLVVLFLAVLLGMAAAVLDVGSWYRADRALQATVDAAALAGAQALPDDPGAAAALAVEYGDKNGGGVAGGDVAFSSTLLPNDTILVETTAAAPGFFSKVFGIASVENHARAKARAGGVSAARWVAPIVVNEQHPLLQCRPVPCFGDPTELELVNLHQPGSGDAAGAFGLINLKRDKQGSVGNDELASWMETGFDEFMPLGIYQSVPSVMFNSSQFKKALSFRVGDEVLFPIYRTIKKGGSTAEYDIIGFVGFTVTGFKGGGDAGEVTGSFTRVIWEGIMSESGGDPDFGVRTVALIE